MMVIATPSEIKKERVKDHEIRYISIFVIDSSSVCHFKPEYYPPQAFQTHRDGLGKGFIRLILDEKDNPAGYWEGTYSGEKKKKLDEPTYCSVISFARAVPIIEQESVINK